MKGKIIRKLFYACAAAWIIMLIIVVGRFVGQEINENRHIMILHQPIDEIEAYILELVPVGTDIETVRVVIGERFPASIPIGVINQGAQGHFPPSSSSAPIIGTQSMDIYLGSPRPSGWCYLRTIPTRVDIAFDDDGLLIDVFVYRPIKW